MKLGKAPVVCVCNDREPCGQDWLGLSVAPFPLFRELDGRFEHIGKAGGCCFSTDQITELFGQFFGEKVHIQVSSNSKSNNPQLSFLVQQPVSYQ